ncbi:hypothetical protein SDC9_201175 [bioreactor metagenome]|uniref:Uncharacterized protein n=1 Tax=bioreactor metagenome TaxID=1076179 RepID=A0A645IQ95_9ZZZZ
MQHRIKRPVLHHHAGDAVEAVRLDRTRRRIREVVVPFRDRFNLLPRFASDQGALFEVERNRLLAHSRLLRDEFLIDDQNFSLRFPCPGIRIP